MLPILYDFEEGNYYCWCPTQSPSNYSNTCLPHFQLPSPAFPCLCILPGDQSHCVLAMPQNEHPAPRSTPQPMMKGNLGHRNPSLFFPPLCDSEMHPDFLSGSEMWLCSVRTCLLIRSRLAAFPFPLGFPTLYWHILKLSFK